MAYAEPDTWETAIKQDYFTLIFTSDEESQQFALDYLSLDLIVQEGSIALYRVNDES